MEKNQKIKRCTQCNVWKQPSQFNVRTASKDGLQPLCRACQNSRDRAYFDGDPSRKEARKIRSKKWQHENPERYKQKVQEWKKKHPDYKKYLDKKAQLWSHYRLTVEAYIEMLESQDFKCKVCQKNKRLYVDHDHSCCPGKTCCGKCVRGLVCSRCNFVLGAIESDPEVMKRAMEYKKEFQDGV